ncbi:hypothetical protein EYF80_040252 [Liparis tanakae]|uniref:Uncharacterized protein n=1 Tax=Liparis tanakae TaxID=230148 RepID=A0A4Z2G9N3_9TELE|nr:hypothetical protein EYF80_040252 [Liparis tanakae]
MDDVVALRLPFPSADTAWVAVFPEELKSKFFQEQVQHSSAVGVKRAAGCIHFRSGTLHQVCEEVQHGNSGSFFNGIQEHMSSERNISNVAQAELLVGQQDQIVTESQSQSHDDSKLTFRRIHWHRSTMVQPRTCMSPSLIADTPNNYTTPRRNIGKKKHRGIQAKKCHESTKHA